MDALARRFRFRRQHTGKAIYLTSRDIEVFQLLNRYRYLRSSFICAFFPSKAKKRTDIIKRLGDLYHELPHYVDRPERQYDYANATHLPAVYEIDQPAAEALKNHGVSFIPFDQRIGGAGRANFAHALMVCDILASIESGCKENGIRFISQEEIRAKVPSLTMSLTWNDKPANLTPDAVFGIEYPNGGKRLFLLEADRGTLNLKSRDHHKNSYEKKLIKYKQLISQKVYQSHFGITSGFFILHVTTREDRMQSMKNLMLDLTDGKGSAIHLFKTMKGDWKVPPPADSHMLTEDWTRAVYQPFNIGVP
jgi:hypothetical protein